MDLSPSSRATAAAYAEVPYDPAAASATSLGTLLGHGALHGASAGLAGPVDVLDLGCGTGVDLAAWARETSGRLVGVELPGAAADLAEARLADAGDRASIVRADLRSLDPDTLGRFDVVLCKGVYYTVPDDLRVALEDLVVNCLAEGGIAAATWYAGALGTLRADIARSIRTGVGPGSAAERVAEARAVIASLTARLPSGGMTRDALAATLENLRTIDDTVFFHEMLNEHFTAVHTGEVSHRLATRGITFLDYTAPTPFGGLADGAERARAADAWDLAEGGYRTALFARSTGNAALAVDRPGIRWSTQLHRSSSEPSLYENPATGVQCRVGSAATAAAMVRMNERPSSWDELVEAARSAGAVPATDPRAELAADLQTLWWNRVIAPRVDGPRDGRPSSAP